MADESSDTSDVELEGMDVDEDEEQVEDEEEDDGIQQVAVAAVAPPSPAVEKTLHDEELRDIEAARKERMELLAAESKKIQPPATKQEQLDYLMAQSDVFAHFLAGTRRVCFSISPVKTMTMSAYTSVYGTLNTLCWDMGTLFQLYYFA